MESVVSYYSLGWFWFYQLGLIVFTATACCMINLPVKNPMPFLGALMVSMVMIIAGNAASNPPETNVVTLAPGEELVGSYVSKVPLMSTRSARVIVRLADGKLSVRDVIINDGEQLEIRQLEIRSITPIEK